jgi:CheY-like chemotaxis protein
MLGKEQTSQFQEQNLELDLLEMFRVLSKKPNMFVFNAIAKEKVIDGALIEKALNMKRSDKRKSLSELFRMDLIRRKSGKYCLTSLGKLIYDLQNRVEIMLSLSHTLKVVDSIEDFSDKHRNEIISCIIKDTHARDLLMQYNRGLSSRIQNKLDEKQEIRKENHLSRSNIMIIEDEPDLLFTYEEILRNEGLEVYGFVDPCKALETLLDFYNFKGKKIDLLIVDIRMPRLNGLQVYKTFKSVDENIKTLFVSALAEADELLRVYPGDESVQLLRKPIDKDYFIKEVKRLLLT